MLDLPRLLPSIVLWVLVLYRLGVLRTPGTQRALWFALLCLACGQTLHIEGVWHVAGAHLGAAGAAVAKQACTIGAAAGVLVLLRGVTGAGGGRRRLALTTALALGAMSVPLLLSHPATPPQQLDQQAVVYTSSWGWVSHWAAVLVYLGWTLVAATRLCAHYSRHAARGPLRTGLRFVGAGTAAGLGIVVLRVTVLAAGFLHDGGLFGPAATAAEPVLLGASLLLIAVGTGYEALARRGAQVRTGWSSRRSLHRLRPLWQAVYAAVPYIALSPGTMNALLGARLGVQHRLYRRVVEIRDGLLALSPYASPCVRERALAAATASGASGAEARAIAEAVWLRAAVAAKAHGQAPTHSATTQHHMLGGHDLLEDVRWLELVATAYAHNPLVERLASGPDAADAAGSRAA